MSHTMHSCLVPCLLSLPDVRATHEMIVYRNVRLPLLCHYDDVKCWVCLVGNGRTAADVLDAVTAGVLLVNGH